MSTLAEVMNYCALRCSVKAPASWVSNTLLTIVEMRSFLEDTVQELQDRLDLPFPVTQEYTITGTGAPNAIYSLPSDFLRLTRDEGAVLEELGNRRVVTPVRTNGEWTALKMTGSAGGGRVYRVIGDEGNKYDIEFYRNLEAGAKVVVSYVSNKWAQNEDGISRSAWLGDTDIPLLPEMLLKLGVIWRFRRHKGLPHADYLAEYETRLSRAINDARGVRRINMGGGVDEGHPMRVPVPDYIPIA